MYRHALLDVLRPAYHDFPHEVLAIAETLQRSDVHFWVEGQTWSCRMARGIVQGGVLSATLFSLVVDRVCDFDGVDVAVVTSMTYLGIPIGFDVSNRDLADSLLGKAWRAFFQYRAVFCNKQVDAGRRLCLLNTYVTSAWAWAACHVRPTKSIVHAFRTAWLTMLTSMLGFSRDPQLEWAQDYAARRRATRAYAKAVGMHDWGDPLVSRLSTWSGHVACMPVDRSRPAAVELHYQGMRWWRAVQRGDFGNQVHPLRASWPGVDRLLQEFVEARVHADADWIDTAQDRDAWRALLVCWRVSWSVEEHDNTLHGRRLIWPRGAGDCLQLAWSVRDGMSVTADALAPLETHGWQVAVDGSWGRVPGRAEKVAAWGLV